MTAIQLLNPLLTVSITYFILLSFKQQLYTEAANRGVLQDKMFLEISQKFTGKHLCKSLFFNTVAGLGLQLYLNRGSDTCVFL